MKTISLTLGSLVLASAVLAQGSAKRHNLQRLDRRSEAEECNKSQVDALWERGAKGPDHVAGMTAVVCYNHAFAYNIEDRSEAHYQEVPGVSQCTQDSVTGLGYDGWTYDCFYFKGKNTFVGQGDGGYINLAINMDADRCEFNKDERKLVCRD